MFETLKKKVWKANIDLYKSGIVIFTWGNVSEFVNSGYIVIKPSGVPYDKMKPEDMVVVDLNANVIEGRYKPSSDTQTHLEIYKNLPEVKSICHTHSIYATAYSQAGIPIIPLGTTHADYFFGTIPITEELTVNDIETNYELNTGKNIVKTVQKHSSSAIPAILVKSHGPFAFGKNAADSVHNAIILETVAKMNYLTMNLNPNIKSISQDLAAKHYFRKHGKNSYYGQTSNNY